MLGFDTTLTISYNTGIGSNLNVLVPVGILFVFGAIGTITNNEVKENISNILYKWGNCYCDRKSNCEHCQKMPNHMGIILVFSYILNE